MKDLVVLVCLEDDNAQTQETLSALLANFPDRHTTFIVLPLKNTSDINQELSRFCKDKQCQLVQPGAASLDRKSVV